MESKRITQRDVAQAAGVTRATVSLALRGDPRIPAKTSARIVQIAESLGYVPDPVLSALASYRWPESHPKRTSAAIGVVEFLEPQEVRPGNYSETIRDGVIGRASALGYSATVFASYQYRGDMRRMLRVMRNRGITGIILLPMNLPTSFDPGAGWEDFSVVTATTAILAPRFHRVVPNQFDNMMRLLERLHERGYRRLGGIFRTSYDARTTHAYSAALSWFGYHKNILMLPDDVSPGTQQRLAREWLRRHTFDIVFAQDPESWHGLRRNKASAKREPGPRFMVAAAHVDQYPRLIGETALRVLTGMMHAHERGIPEHPQITTIDGAIREDLLPPPLR